MKTALVAAAVLAVCFWPPLMLAGLGWWSENRRPGADRLQPDRGPGGVPGYAVVAVVLGAVSAVLAGGVVWVMGGLR